MNTVTRREPSNKKSKIKIKRVGKDLVGKVLHHPSAATWG